MTIGFIISCLIPVIAASVLMIIIGWRLHNGHKMLDTISDVSRMQANASAWIRAAGRRGYIKVNGWLLCPSCGRYSPNIPYNVPCFCPTCGKMHPFIHSEDVSTPQVNR